MAITKIWSVKSRLDTSLKYIANPDKTTLQLSITLHFYKKNLIYKRNYFVNLVYKI